tara:strand:- start:12383 stop:13078 length:696 start_codon:yes stop_codon:yes gene_type:complete
MRFLKSQYVSKYSPNDNTVRVNPYGRAVMDFNGGIMIPKGTTAQRPQLTGVRHPIDANGYLRYNIDNDTVTGQPIGIEAYVGGNWEVVRAPGAAAVSIETFGPGNAVDTLFGPLAKVPSSANNIIVLVENVFQIPTTNFTLNQNPTSTGTGEEVDSGNFVTSTEYIITATGSTDFVAEHGAADNNPGTIFTAASAGTPDATGLARETGWYLTFNSAVPLDKYITVFFGFAN